MDKSPHQSLEDLFGSVKSYAETKIEIAKLKLADKAGTAAGSLITFIIVLLLALLVIIFAGIAVAVIISDHYGIRYLGFAIVGGTFLLLLLLVAVFRDGLINRPVTNSFIRNLFNHEEEENS